MILKVGRKARREKEKLHVSPPPKTDSLPAPPPKAKSGSGKPTKRESAVVQPGAHGRQDVAQDSLETSVSVNDNADSICWFCHADVSNLANNKCAGCRKVTTHLCLQIFRPISVSGALLRQKVPESRLEATWRLMHQDAGEDPEEDRGQED